MLSHVLQNGVTLRDRIKSVDIRTELGVSSIQEKVREMRLRWHRHMHKMEEKEVRVVGYMRVPGESNSEMYGWRPKGYAGTADRPGGCTGQNILEIKNSGR